MNREITPSSIAAPAANYAHAMLSERPARLLHTSGVVPTRPDGSVPEALSAQAVVVWSNILAVLAEAEMVPGDIVSITTYVVAAEIGSLGAVMAARDAVMGGHRASSTLLTVPALARPEWKMEIAVVAAQ
jgi:2-iminobutanoate/2-iminopropanoate deaminase